MHDAERETTDTRRSCRDFSSMRPPRITQHPPGASPPARCATDAGSRTAPSGASPNTAASGPPCERKTEP